MAAPSIAEVAKPYLDYLDKEMTIEGILSAFCVAVGAVVFDKVLGVKADSASSFVGALQYFSYPYVLAAIAGLMTAALFFYLQRSTLAWLYGEISLAVVHEMAKEMADSPFFMKTFDDADSWSLWNRYKFGWSFLSVTAVESLLALVFAIKRWSLLPGTHWLIASLPFVVAGVMDLIILTTMKKRDERVLSRSGEVGGRDRDGGDGGGFGAEDT